MSELSDVQQSVEEAKENIRTGLNAFTDALDLYESQGGELSDFTSTRRTLLKGTGIGLDVAEAATSDDPTRAAVGLIGERVGDAVGNRAVIGLVTIGTAGLLTGNVVVAGAAYGAAAIIYVYQDDVGRLVFEGIYDGAVWTINEITEPAPVGELLSGSSIGSQLLIPGIEGYMPGDGVPLEVLVNTPGDYELATAYSSYFNHNAALWEGAISQSGLTLAQQQSIDINKVEQLKQDYIDALRASGKSVDVGTIALIYGEIAATLGEDPGRVGAFNSNNSAGAILRKQILGPLVDPAELASLSDASSTILRPDAAEVLRFSSESVLFSDEISTNALRKFDERTGAYHSIARVTVLDPLTDEPFSVWVTDNGDSVNGLVTISQAELDHFAQTGEFPAGNRFKALAKAHGRISDEQIGGFETSIQITRHVTIAGRNYIQATGTDGFLPHQYIDAKAKCFVAGTLIDMADGSKRRIEAVKAGDWVQSFDNTGELRPGRVIEVFESATNDLIALSNGTVATSSHPFLTDNGEFKSISEIVNSGLSVVDRDGNQIFVAGRLKLASGDLTVRASGALAVQEQNLTAVYNFSVGGFHTYIADGLRVHNTSILDLASDDEVVTALLFGEDEDIQISLLSQTGHR